MDLVGKGGESFSHRGEQVFCFFYREVPQFRVPRYVKLIDIPMPATTVIEESTKHCKNQFLSIFAFRPSVLKQILRLAGPVDLAFLIVSGRYMGIEKSSHVAVGASQTLFACNVLAHENGGGRLEQLGDPS
ncbi:hypothetical protein Slin14017_G111860 [Septoria linicola]|nr:hypothetical protein Slin14017_G111860 [Septoria linicola]